MWTSQLSLILTSLFKIIENSGPRVSELALDLLASALSLPIEFDRCLDELVSGILSIAHLHNRVEKSSF